jgi:hypothetical protein
MQFIMRHAAKGWDATIQARLYANVRREIGQRCAPINNGRKAPSAPGANRAALAKLLADVNPGTSTPAPRKPTPAVPMTNKARLAALLAD